MKTREPSSEAHLAARIMRAYPSLSPYSAASLAMELCAIERAQRRHAERCCNGDYRKHGERNGKGYEFLPGHKMATPVMVEDPAAEKRAYQLVERRLAAWVRNTVKLVAASEAIESDHGRDARELGIAKELFVETEGDPRGPVLKIQFPGETEPTGV